MNYDDVNKVYLKGTILSAPKVEYDNYANENILHFILAVPRDKPVYPNGYNTDKYNYFYCLLTERNHTLSVLKKAARTFERLMLVEIKGCLDNRLNKKAADTNTPRVNYRALNLFVSTINVLAINKSNDDRDEETIKAEKSLLNRIRNNFGSDVDVVVKDDAYNYDYFGFEKNDDLPDY